MTSGLPLPGGELAAAPDAPAQRPVFADLSGRRRRQMRAAGLAVGVLLLGCLVVMAVGLLGGPRAPLLPWSALNAGGGPGRPAAGGGVTAPPSPRPGAAAVPPGGTGAGPASGNPAATRAAGGAGSGASAAAGNSAAPAASARPTASASASPAVTNHAGRTPPGLNATPSARPSPSRHTGAA